MPETVLIYPSKMTRWSGAKEHLSKIDSVCIDTVLFSMRVICTLVTTIFAPGLCCHGVRSISGPGALELGG